MTVNPEGAHICRCVLLGQSGKMSPVSDVTLPTDLKLQVRTWWVEAMKEATDVKPGCWWHSKEQLHFSSPPWSLLNALYFK